MSRAVRARAVAVLATGALLLSACGSGGGTGGSDAGVESSAASSSASGQPSVKIATGVDVQTRVLAHLYQQRLAADGISASVVDVGNAREQIVDALQAGRATMVPDFTGDLYVYTRQNERPASPQPSASPSSTRSPTPDTDAPRGLLDSLGQLLGITGETGPSDDDVYRALPGALPRGLTVLNSSSAQRTDRVVVTAATNAQYNLGDLNTIEEHCPELAVGMARGYADSAQGERGLKAYYDCAPKATPEFATSGELVDALLSDKVQAAVLRSSDPAIADDGLVELGDPNRLFRPERAVVLSSEGMDARAVASANAVSADLTSADLTTITRLAGGSDPAMSPQETATFLREQPR